VTRHTSDALDRLAGVASRQRRDLHAELRRIDALAAERQYDDVTEALLQLATEFHYAGLPRLVLAVIADLRALVPPEHLSPASDAWAMNYEALGQSALGDERLAGEIHEAMLARGRELDDEQIISTALQNLGVRALLAGDTAEAIRLGREAYRMKRALGDDFAAAQILLNLANALRARDEPDEAERILTDFAPLISRVRDDGLRASLYGSLGQLQSSRGDFETADANLRKALRYARRAGDLNKMAIAQQNLGSLEVDRGQPGRGVRWYRKALRTAESADAPPQLELIYRSLARALHRSGRDKEAARALEQAQAAASRFGDDRLRAGALADLGALSAAHGEGDQARALLAEALEILAAYDDAEPQIGVLRNLAVLELQLGDAAAAITHVERALALSDATDRDLRADLLEVAARAALAGDNEQGALAYLARDVNEAAAIDAHEGVWSRLDAATLLRGAGALEPSLAFYEAAAAAADELEDDQLAFDARNDRATALLDLERYDEAVAELEALAAFASDRPNRVMEQQAFYNLGEAARRLGDAGAATRHGRAALELARDLDDVRAEIESLCNLALALSDAGEQAEATQSYRHAERLARRTGDRLLEARALSGRAGIDFIQGRYSAAAKLYEQAADRSVEDDHEYLQDLAGALQSLSAAGDKNRLEQVAQRLVDVAQRSGGEADAVTALAQSGRWWLTRGQLDEAATLFAVAMVLGAVAAEIDIEPAEGEAPISVEGAQSMLMPAMLMVIHAQSELGDRSDAFYEQVFTVLNEQYESIGHHLRFVLDAARDAAADLRGEDQGGG
jgi:tetratricopeptide (TPR) repeat protein